MLPVTAYNLLQGIDLLSNASRVFARKCILGLEADVKKCGNYLEQSLAMCTALAPIIGYDAAARIAKAAYETGRTVREVAREMCGLDEAKLAEVLDVRKQTG
jgi:fumarate hydratase class II